MEEKYNNLKIAERGARISILAYIVLAALKLGVGYLASSKALIADGLNNNNRYSCVARCFNWIKNIKKAS